MAIPLKRLEGKYEILDKIQEGGMGAIYKVRHRLLGDLRVVKVLRPHLQGDPGLRVRFLAEARAATQLGHPNIAQIFDCSIDEDGIAFIVMELIRGMTLAELLAAVGPPPPALALEIARQGLRAVGHLHKHQVVHRDVSPDNLMLTRDVDGRPLVKLIDLGIAREVEGSSRLTGVGVFIGKFRYAAPETFDDGATSDPRCSDLYSFALVLYELLTGRFPIPGKSASSLIAGHLFRPPIDFAESDPEGRVPEPARRAVLKALAKRPEERYADAESFASALGIASEVDLSSPEVQRVLELTQDEDQRPKNIGRPPGSTQSRLNLQFEAENTPASVEAPLDWDAPTEILRPVPEPGGESPGRPPAHEEEETRILGEVPSAETRRLDVGQLRALQVDELTARARGYAREEDFQRARDLLRKALALIPDHRQATALLASVEACIEVSELEAQRLVQAEETPAFPVVEQNERDQAVERSSDHGAGAAHTAAARIRRQPAIKESATIIRKPIAPATEGDRVTPNSVTPNSVTPDAAPVPASAALGQTLRAIGALRDEGRVGDALERLNRALREFGPQPTLQTLRYELGEELLDRDEEENSASQVFEIATEGDSSPTVVSAMPPVAAPPEETQARPENPPSETPDLVEAPLRGLSDATIRSFPAPVQHAPDRPGPPTAHPTRTMVVAGVTLVAVFAALVFFLTRDGTVAEHQPLETEDVAAADLSPGSLAVDALPWAEIVGLENPAVEEAPPISPSRFTPVILSLPPGDYLITLRYPPTGQVEERAVRIDSDVRVDQRFIFESLDAGAYFERIGW